MGRIVETTGEFLAEAERAFAFLRDRYGFEAAVGEQVPLATFPHGRSSISEAPHTGLDHVAAFVRFRSSTVVVELVNDPRGEMTCQLWRTEQPKETRVDLWHLLRFVQAPEVTDGGWVYEYGTTSFKRVIEALASSLARYGERWLRDDRSAWAALTQWWADGMPERSHIG